MKLIYVASPYAGDILKNTEFAKKACQHVMEQGHAFFAPHLLYPAILDENKPMERKLGMEMGMKVLTQCDEVWCYGEQISHGMLMEIAEADRCGIPVRRVMEQEQGFVIGKERRAVPVETPAMTMAVGMM